MALLRSPDFGIVFLGLIRDNDFTDDDFDVDGFLINKLLNLLVLFQIVQQVVLEQNVNDENDNKQKTPFLISVRGAGSIENSVFNTKKTVYESENCKSTKWS